MASFFSGPIGHSPCGNAAHFKSTLAEGHSWRRPDTSSPPCSSNSSPLPSPPSTPPSSSSSWRRRPSSPPSSNPWAASSNWRTGSSPSKPTSSLRYDVLEPGDVVLLPAQKPADDSIIFEHAGARNSEPWGHPVVITEKFLKDGKECVHIRLCTSFNGQQLESRKAVHQWQYFALIDSEVDAEPPAGVQLFTMASGSGKFRKRSYVNLSPNSRYPIELCHLQAWSSRRPLKFDAKSTKRIVDAYSSDY